MDTLKNYIQENLVITNKEAEELGYTRHNLSELTKSGQLERLRPGLYQLKGKVIDDFVLISSNSNRIIFSHQTALYLHDLSDRTPNVFHISVPQGYNASHIKNRYKDLQVHYVKKDLYELGKTEIKSPQGNLIPVYDIDRTICDIIIDREKIDKQIFTEAIKRYFKSQNKNLRRLIKYSRLFKIEDEIRKYMEVLSKI
ncbi:MULTISPECIES: type IV toxin-antitoxin system AbiEi family antitoxin domain-containing protein [Bacillota]|uniref:Transcriptional regulator n=1 Tax=Criibacterium bergeronii TaxID=1871336 RepID=A0A371IL51_9FIRM|nr:MULTISPECIES: type IV toxin-antitoxin system AbiEi family antitoxin domain-containing protein [Bacillota]MBS4882666.1 type IV toxin-antitoxin system AbiEi family antitoxin domain-containing protein [Peptoniphilus harei]MDU5587687.1 type IV toxin-antitoxin system AbiEi family antitoxin domain-containing protein [Finegoldia magna]HBC4778737.1 type IV toxin-antitoxin system AbiEi family antitoxin domain-containing protein [Enterococcus faecalis]HER5437336.1 type IV toxin-antitoxin system AbiEi 